MPRLGISAGCPPYTVSQREGPRWDPAWGLPCPGVGAAAIYSELASSARLAAPRLPEEGEENFRKVLRTRRKIGTAQRERRPCAWERQRDDGTALCSQKIFVVWFHPGRANATVVSQTLPHVLIFILIYNYSCSTLVCMLWKYLQYQCISCQKSI